MSDSIQVGVQVRFKDSSKDPQEIRVPYGANLRKALLETKLTPYQGAKNLFNCRGMGICGTCKILVKENGEWWERRSCQIQCFQSLEIQLK